jgi:glycosyltransferase involved in cell wall biosynthesis
MTHPLVSIIIPAFNVELFIEETIRSVLNQTYSNIECIVIDDGSTDSTAKIIKSIQISDQRIQYYYQVNKGVSSARNYGFKLSKGEFICFLDADDIWLPSRIEKMVILFQKLSKEYGLIHSDISHIDEESKLLGTKQTGLSGRVLDDLLLLQQCVIPAPSSIMVRRKTMEKTGLFNIELSNAADYDFFLRVAKYYKVKRIPEVLSYYRKHPSNMSSNISVIEKDQVKVFNFAKENSLFKNKAFEKLCFSNMYLILAACHIVDNRQYYRGVNYIIKSIYFYPKNIKKLISKILKRL